MAHDLIPLPNLTPLLIEYALDKNKPQLDQQMVSRSSACLCNHEVTADVQALVIEEVDYQVKADFTKIIVLMDHLTSLLWLSALLS